MSESTTSESTTSGPAASDANAPGAGLDLAAVNRWLVANAPGVPELVRAWLISGGRSNLTYGVAAADGDEYCLRRPPLGPLVKSAHNVAREYRIMHALRDTDVPVPPMVALCEDESVIGGPFFLSRFVEGTVAGSEEAIESLSPTVRERAAGELARRLAAIHSLDLKAIGLDELSPPVGYVERQLRRWRSQLTPDDLARRPAFGQVADLLDEQLPAQQRVALAHGDFKLGNVIIDAEGAVRAVLDWELTALGDPLADLGWLVASWSGPDESAPRVNPPPGRFPGFGDRSALVSGYGAASDLDLSKLPYYEAFAEWRWACIDLGIYKRYTSGAMGESQIDLDVVEGELDDRLRIALDRLS